MTDALPPRRGLSLDARLAVVEAGLADQREQMRRDRVQRDQEHQENQKLLRTILTDVQDLVIRVTNVSENQKLTDGRVVQNTADIAEIAKWRDGLQSEIRGALKLPKALLALWPVIVFGVGAAAWLLATARP